MVEPRGVEDVVEEAGRRRRRPVDAVEEVGEGVGRVAVGGLEGRQELVEQVGIAMGQRRPRDVVAVARVGGVGRGHGGGDNGRQRHSQERTRQAGGAITTFTGAARGWAWCRSLLGASVGGSSARIRPMGAEGCHGRRRVGLHAMVASMSRGSRQGQRAAELAGFMTPSSRPSRSAPKTP